LTNKALTDDRTLVFSVQTRPTAVAARVERRRERVWGLVRDRREGGRRGRIRVGKVWRAKVRIEKFTAMERIPVMGVKMGGRWREVNEENDEGVVGVVGEVEEDEEDEEDGGDEGSCRRQSIIACPENRFTR